MRGRAPKSRPSTLFMKLIEEFRQNAEEWRSFEKLAATADHRRRIAGIANAWRSLAEKRERIIATPKNVGLIGGFRNREHLA